MRCGGTESTRYTTVGMEASPVVQRFRDSINHLSRRLSELGPSARLLIGSIAIILAMGFFLVSQYAAGPSMTPVSVRVEEKLVALESLRGSGHEVSDSGQPGSILVETKKKAEITGFLEKKGYAPRIDDDVVGGGGGGGGWQAESEMQENWRRDRVSQAEKNIRMIEGVDTVNISFSGGKRKAFVLDGPAPSANVMVRLKFGELDRNLAESIALIAITVENDLLLENITVTDGRNGGRAFTFGEGGGGIGGDYLSKVRAFERDARERLNRLVLRAFPQAQISVNAQILTAEIHEKKTQIGKPVKAERSKRTDESRTPIRGSANGGTPGYRSNSGLAQAQVGGAATIGGNPVSPRGLATRETEEIENIVGVPGVQTEIVQTANHPIKFSAAVLLSLAEVKAAIRSELEDDSAEVTAEDLDLAKENLRAEIVALLEPLVDNSSLRDGGIGEVKVAIMPFAVRGGGESAGVRSVTETIAGLAGGESGQAFKNAGLVGLALVSLAMMFMMVRRSSEADVLPTAEELAGVPPVLDDDSAEIVGEADESTPALVGVELDDEDLRRKQMLDQLNELIKKEPSEVATLLRRWMRTDP
jgi:flagellar biosynthesis/type III secretory pathway M-ring protein FliF/YscJ